MTNATLDALEAAALAWLDARGAESIAAGRTRWEMGDDAIGPLESIVRAIERARTRSEVLQEPPSRMIERARENIAGAFATLRKMEVKMHRDDALAERAMYLWTLAVSVAGWGVVGLVWWAVA